MPPILALFLTVAFIAFLFHRDARQKSNVTGALWLPTIWMLIIGSRFVSQWLSVLGMPVGATTIRDGSPIDALVFLGLIVAGTRVLHKRKVRLSAIVRNNIWLAVFLIYCFLAVLWSDYPFVAFKRWIKILGHPIMALVIVTEPDVQEAVTILMKRCAYVLIPVSILFIKYYPQYGRGFSPWSGAAFNTGITTDKNALGYVCFVLGLFFIWHLLGTLRTERGRARRNEIFLTAGFLGMIWWLLLMSNSKTSLTSLLLGALTMIVLSFRVLNRRFFGTYVITGVLIASAAEMAFGIYAGALQLLGRNPTLTDRTKIWEELLKVEINPILGAGFESFWLGDGPKRLSAFLYFEPNQAHNGYLEVYLNLGWIGVIVLAGLLLATYRKDRTELLKNFRWGQFRMGFFFAILLYNCTEATFKALHLVWFVFYIIALDYPKLRSYATEALPDSDQREREEAPLQAGAAA